MKVFKIIPSILLSMLLSTSVWCISEDTVDISYILPDGGNFTNGTVGWVIETGRDSGGWSSRPRPTASG